MPGPAQRCWGRHGLARRSRRPRRRRRVETDECQVSPRWPGPSLTPGQASRSRVQTSAMSIPLSYRGGASGRVGDGWGCSIEVASLRASSASQPKSRMMSRQARRTSMSAERKAQGQPLVRILARHRRTGCWLTGASLGHLGSHPAVTGRAAAGSGATRSRTPYSGLVQDAGGNVLHHRGHKSALHQGPESLVQSGPGSWLAMARSFRRQARTPPGAVPCLRWDHRRTSGQAAGT